MSDIGRMGLAEDIVQVEIGIAAQQPFYGLLKQLVSPVVHNYRPSCLES